MLRTDWGEQRRRCSSIFSGHIKVCSRGSHWPGVLKEVGTSFYHQHLKRCRSPRASMCNLFFSPLFFFFFFTVPPNDMCRLYVILLIIIVGIVKNEPVSGEMWISWSRVSSEECMSVCGVDMNLALLLPEGPQADVLFMHPACCVIDFCGVWCVIISFCCCTSECDHDFSQDYRINQYREYTLRHSSIILSLFCLFRHFDTDDILSPSSGAQLVLEIWLWVQISLMQTLICVWNTWMCCKVLQHLL